MISRGGCEEQHARGGLSERAIKALCGLGGGVTNRKGGGVPYL